MLMAISCNDILDKNPLDSLTPEQAFETEANLKMYSNSLYELTSTLPTGPFIFGQPSHTGIQKFPFVTDNMSDLTFNVMFVEEYFSPGAFKSIDNPFWEWGDLRRINYFIENYKNSPVPDNIKNHYAGVAHWFRAKFYFDKVKLFGDVPWYGKTLSSTDEDLYKKRDPRTLVMDSVLADLNFAIKNLSPQKDNTSTTITKWVALGLKSRICLFEGTFRKYHPELGLENTATLWLEQAAEAAKEIMDSGMYSLYSTSNINTDYHSLFTSADALSKEVMLASAYSETLNILHSATSNYSDQGGRYMTSLLKRFVNTYLNIDGSRFTDIQGYDTIFFTNEVKKRDLRLTQTIRTPSYIRTDGSNPAPYGANSLTLYHPIKFSSNNPYYDTRGDESDIPLMRYAEVLLNYAEAKAELGNFTESDWNNTIGLLRKRAGITNTTMPTTIDTYLQNNFYKDVNSIAILEIRRERAIELILERFRFDDLVRWKEARNLEKEYDGIYVPALDQLYDLTGDGKPDVSFVYKKPANVVQGVYYFIIDNKQNILSEGSKGRLILKAELKKEFPDYKYFWPIPYLQLQLNPNLVQNEGWDHP